MKWLVTAAVAKFYCLHVKSRLQPLQITAERRRGRASMAMSNTANDERFLVRYHEGHSTSRKEVYSLLSATVDGLTYRLTL